MMVEEAEEAGEGYYSNHICLLAFWGIYRLHLLLQHYLAILFDAHALDG